MSHFEWDGSDDSLAVFNYAVSLGPRDTHGAQPLCKVLPLSMIDCNCMIELYRSCNSNVLLPECQMDNSQLEAFRADLRGRIASLMNQCPGRDWFVKTSRHSFKDATLVRPTQQELLLFKEQLSLMKLPGETESLDDIDFGPGFEAMCRSRLLATIVRTGEDVLCLIDRSQRVHDDLVLQLRLQPSPWDNYLCFMPFDHDMAIHPLHEFRCFISDRKLRCIAQYSYLLKCPIPACKLIQAAVMMGEESVRSMRKLPENILDAAIDIQCVPMSDESFQIRIIEINPLGPGCVWGTLNWDIDKDWLLGKEMLPTSRVVRDSNGGETTYQICTLINENSEFEEQGSFIIAYTSAHPKGLSLGALSHMPPEYMLELWEAWKLDRKSYNNSQMISLTDLQSTVGSSVDERNNRNDTRRRSINDFCLLS
jgi:hypothetical protein